MKILLFFYDVIFVFVILFYPLVYLAKRKFTFSSYRQRLSFISLAPQKKKTVWIQAVSVGEVLLLKKLVDRIREDASVRVVITTTTLTGHEVACKYFCEVADIFFFPFDIGFIVRNVIAKVDPALFIAVETELWPNLFRQLSEKNVPILLINGRISDRAYARYRVFRFFIKSVLNRCAYIGVQNEFYRRRFIALGARPDAVVTSGNMKFDSLSVDLEHFDAFKEYYLAQLKSAGEYLFIAASTHSPEEKMVLQTYKHLQKVHPVKLIIAPRHPQRIIEVERLIRSAGFVPVRVSALRENRPRKEQVYVLDTVGQLFDFYGICDICFVGGSLVDCGGHNILEPVFLSKPTLFGPFMHNFSEIEKVVLGHRAALRVEGQQQLTEYLGRLLEDGDMRDELARNSKEVFSEERMHLQKNIEVIEKYLKKQPATGDR